MTTKQLQQMLCLKKENRDDGWGGRLRAQKTEASEKQSYLKHTEERRGPIQLALTYRSHPVNGKDGVMGREKERWGVEEEVGQGSSECDASSQRNQGRGRAGDT